MELYLALVLATTVLASDEKGTLVLPIQPVDIDHGYVRRSVDVDLPLDVSPLQKGNNPDAWAELYKRPDNEINHAGLAYIETVGDGNDYNVND